MTKEKKYHGEDSCDMAETVGRLHFRVDRIEQDVGNIKSNQDKMISNEEDILTELKEVNKWSSEFRAFYQTQRYINEDTSKTLSRITDMFDKILDRQNQQDRDLISFKYESKLDNNKQDLKYEKEKQKEYVNSIGNQFVEGIKKHGLKLAVGAFFSGLAYTLYQMLQAIQSIPK